MTDFLAGAAIRVTTPSPALLSADRTWLWGYGDRAGPCRRVDQDLNARALAIADPLGGRVVLISADIGALDRAMTDRVKARIAAAHPDLGPARICLNVSHTHYAPVAATIPTWQLGVGFVDPGYQAFLEDQIVGAAADALAAMRPASLAWGRGATRISRDRHPLPDGSHNDPTVDVLRATDTVGRTIAVVFSTACHPTAHFHTDDANGVSYDDGVSADFPGFARSYIEAEFGGVGLFLQGYAGTCVPINGLTDESIGRTLASSVGGILREGMEDLSGTIGAWLTEIFLPIQYLDPATLPGVAANAPSYGTAVSDLGPLLTRWVARMQALGGRIPASLPTPMQAIQIGAPPSACHIVASGHEVTTDFAPRARALWPFPRVTVIGYSNAQLAYLTSAAVILHADDRANFPYARANYEAGTACLW
ncbi:MAG: hypothetical protein ACR2FH_04235 [Caulobacteraceae bacterium]